MDKWICIHRYVGKSTINGYKLKNKTTGEIVELTPQELKANYTKYNPINLKMIKGNKIYYTPYEEFIKKLRKTRNKGGYRDDT